MRVGRPDTEGMYTQACPAHAKRPALWERLACTWPARTHLNEGMYTQDRHKEPHTHTHTRHGQEEQPRNVAPGERVERRMWVRDE